MNLLISSCTFMIIMLCLQNAHPLRYFRPPKIRRITKTEKPSQLPAKTCNCSCPKSTKASSVASGRQTEPSLSSKEACKAEVDDEIAMSFKSLVLVGDRDLALSLHDEHHADHCRDAKQHMKVFTDHANCVKGKHGSMLQLIGNGFKKSVTNRCNSKIWHSQFIRFSKCIDDPKIFEQYHVCNDKVYEAQKYILRNIPAKDQVTVMCCTGILSTKCMREHVTMNCGANAANFILLTTFEAYADFIVTVCKGKSEEYCVDKYKEALVAFRNIWSSEVTPKHNGTYKQLFKMIQNQFDFDES